MMPVGRAPRSLAGGGGRNVLLATALFLVYVSSAKLGLRLALLHPSATPVWAPTGVALAALLAFGNWLWPAILLGAFVTNLSTEGSWSTSLGIAAGNTLEALVASWLVRRYAGGARAFENAEDTLRFVVLAGLVATAVSATVGVTSLAAGGYAAWAGYAAIWVTWWLGDASGAVIVAPLLLLWIANPKPGWRGRKLVEAALLLVAAVGVGEVVFGGALSLPVSRYSLTFLCLPPLVWAALRFGPREAATVIAVLSAIAIARSLRGAGAFGALSPNESLVVLQAFMATMATVTLPMAAMVSDWRRAAQAVERSEGRHTAMVQASLDAIVAMDAEGRISEFNPAAETMFGWRRDEVVGRPLADVIIPASFRARHRDGLARYLATGEETVLGRRLELTAVRRNGEAFPVELAITRIPSGGVPSFTGFVRDITERRRSEEQRSRLLRRAQQARAEAEAASRLKDDFLATLSHELRTPLNAIVGWSRMLLGKQMDASGSERAIAVIERNARAQAQIVEDLLDVSRIITGRLRLDVQPVDLGLLVEQGLDVVRPAAVAKRIELHAELDHDLAPVSGDPQRLQQVLWNLLSNAVKFTPEGGRIDVRLARGASGARVTVLDSGGGISPDFMPYLFDRFRQADSTTTRTHGGLGLGLAIVRHLVELHGGTVHAANRTDTAGAVFTVTLPLRPVRPALELPPEGPGGLSRPAVLDRIPRLDGLRVLAVDDEEQTRELVSEVLTLSGAEVTSALSAEQALAALAALRPDVLICDVGMPGQDGFTLISAVRALEDRQQACVPAIALTAYARAEDRARGHQAGFDAYLAKPVDPAVLCDTIYEVTRGKPPAD